MTVEVEKTELEFFAMPFVYGRNKVTLFYQWQAEPVGVLLPAYFVSFVQRWTALHCQ